MSAITRPLPPAIRRSGSRRGRRRLLWRSGPIPLPGWLSNNGGDTLWALMVFVGCGFLWPRASTLTVVSLALACAWGVELSQPYRAP